MQAHIHEFNDVHIQQTGVQSSQQYITLYLKDSSCRLHDTVSGSQRHQALKGALV